MPLYIKDDDRCACFADACARANDARLLFIGDDFNRMDISLAMPR